MGRLVDMKENTYGHLTVLYKNSVRSPSGKLITKWHCKCDCGNECDKYRKDLETNYNISCGKCRPRNLRKDTNDLTNMTFGKLTVLGFDYNKREEQYKNNEPYKAYWICQCSCEAKTITSIRGDHLTSGIVVSCGCYHSEISREIPKQNKKTNEIIKLKDSSILIKSSNSDDYFRIDEEDYDLVKDFCWHSVDGYASAPISKDDIKKGCAKSVRMSRLITKCGLDDEHTVVDHINHDITDNRKFNLRKSSDSQNNWNKKESHNGGIIYNSINNMWNSYINYNLQRINLGSFKSYNEAQKIRLKAEHVFYNEYIYKIGENKMIKEKSILIKINDMNDVKEFANEVTKFQSEINIYYTDDKYYDAKSILAIIALDISIPRYIEILSDNKQEIEDFKNTFKKFSVEE